MGVATIKNLRIGSRMLETGTFCLSRGLVWRHLNVTSHLKAEKLGRDAHDLRV